MRSLHLLITIIMSGLTSVVIRSQPLHEERFSITTSFGPGKIQYYAGGSPSYILASDEKAIGYSPSWNIKIERNFKLTDHFDLSIGLSHFTITEKSERTARPNWLGIDEKKLVQGFFHLVPNLVYKFNNPKVLYNLGLRLGTANFIGSTIARESSSTFGNLHGDLALETGLSYQLFKKIVFDAEWLHGISKYDLTESSQSFPSRYFKYHSFQFGFRYVLIAKN